MLVTQPKDISFALCNEGIKGLDISNMENVPNRMFLEYVIGLTKETKESCCYGHPVTKKKTKRQIDIFGNVMHFV